MSLREEIKKYFEDNGEEMWTDYDLHIDEIFSLFQKHVKELLK